MKKKFKELKYEEAMHYLCGVFLFLVEDKLHNHGSAEGHGL